MANGYGRPPRLDEMMRGDIYAEEGGLSMAPSYTIPQPRDEVKSILDESGYSDFMLQKESAKRKKHIEKIMDLTGGKAKIVGAEQYMTKEGKARTGDPEKAKKWKSLPEMDKMMVSQVASGQKQPQEYRAEKQQQEQQVLDMLKVMSSKMLTEGTGRFKGKGITPEAVGEFARGEGGEMIQKPKTTRHITTATGGGRGRGAGAGDIKERAQIQKEIAATETQATNALKEANKYLTIDPITKEVTVPSDPNSFAKYQEKLNEHYTHSIIASAQKRNIPKGKAETYGENIMNISVAEDPSGEPVTYDNKLNIANPEVKQALIKAIVKYELYQHLEGKVITAKDILEDLKKRQKRYLPDYGDPSKY